MTLFPGPESRTRFPCRGSKQMTIKRGVNHKPDLSSHPVQGWRLNIDLLGMPPPPRPNSAADALGRYCNSEMAVKTIALFELDTLLIPFMTRDTVAVETQASLATSLIVYDWTPMSANILLRHRPRMATQFLTFSTELRHPGRFDTSQKFPYCGATTRALVPPFTGTLIQLTSCPM